MRVLELFQVSGCRTWGFRVWVPCIENPKVYLHPEPFSAADLVVACSEKNSEGAALRGPSTRIMPVDTSQHLPQHTHTHTHTPHLVVAFRPTVPKARPMPSGCTVSPALCCQKHLENPGSKCRRSGPREQGKQKARFCCCKPRI